MGSVHPVACPGIVCCVHALQATGSIGIRYVLEQENGAECHTYVANYYNLCMLLYSQQQEC